MKKWRIWITCSHCHKPRRIEQFYKNCHSANGLSYWCKLCYRAYNQQRYQANHMAYLERNRIAYANRKIKLVERLMKSS